MPRASTPTSPVISAIVRSDDRWQAASGAGLRTPACVDVRAAARGVTPRFFTRPEACRHASAGYRAVAAKEIRRHPRFLRGLRPHLPRRRLTERNIGAGQALREEAGENALGIYLARRKAVRVRRGDDVLLPAQGQAGHEAEAPAGRPAVDADDVLIRIGQPDARLHADARRGVARRRARDAGAEAGATPAAGGIRLADSRSRAADSGVARPRDLRRPGRPLEFFVLEPEGKHRTDR